MASSVLLEIVRNSILEVFQAKRNINYTDLLKQYPILQEKVKTTINIYYDNKLRGTYSSITLKPLLDDIVYNAKKAAFESKKFNPLSVSEYIDSEIELILHTADGDLSHKEKSIIS
jgi:AMMECR1 domain-containing protein